MDEEEELGLEAVRQWKEINQSPSTINRYSVKRVRRKLFREDPHCYWCGRITVLFDPPIGQRTPGDTATVDHIKDRRQVASVSEYRAPENVVLACYGCNKRRNDIEQDRRENKI